MPNDLFEMTDAQFQQWLREQGISSADPMLPTEENLCCLVSNALRTVDRKRRAQMFVEIANMSLALADKTLGAQLLIASCLVTPRH